MNRFSVGGQHFRTFMKVVYCLVACISTAAYAQTTLDLDPPAVQHSAPLKLKSGKPLAVSAIITDDSGIDEVTLYHRPTASSAFISLPMTNSQGDEYTAQLPTEKGQKSIFYYIEVVDKRGNRLLEGAPDSPFTVQEAKRSNNVLYLVLGAVALGAIAAAAGGSDDGPVTSDPTTRPLSLTATVPE